MMNQEYVQPGPGGFVSPKTCPLAIWSLVLGILSMFCAFFTGIPAIVLGVISLSRIKASGGMLLGKGMAIAGLVIGCVGCVGSFVVGAAIMAGMMLPALAIARDEARILRCTNNARQIITACKSYSGEHEGRLPSDLMELKKYLPATRGESIPDVLVCPAAADDSKPSYQIVFPAKDSGVVSAPALADLPANTVVIREVEPNHRRGMVVGYADGRADFQQSGESNDTTSHWRGHD